MLDMYGTRSEFLPFVIDLAERLQACPTKIVYPEITLYVLYTCLRIAAVCGRRYDEHAVMALFRVRPTHLDGGLENKILIGRLVLHAISAPCVMHAPLGIVIDIGIRAPHAYYC